MTQSQPPKPGDFIPFLVFLAFGYICLTMGKPDRLPWEQPAKANDGTPPVKPQCIASNPSPGVFTWKDCPPDQATDSPKIFNTLTNRWE